LLGRPDYTIKPNSVVEDYTFDAMDRIDIQRHYALDNGNVNMTTPFLRTEFDYTYRADGQKTGLTEKEVLGGQTRTSTTSWAYDNAGRLTSETIDHWDNNADQTESYVLDLFGNRVSRTVNKPSTAFVDQIFSYLYNANDQVTSETLDNGISGAGVDRTTTYGWTQTQQTSKSVVTPTVSRVTQAMSYGLSGQLERVVTTTQNGSGTVTGRSRVDYRSNTQGFRSISVDWNDANLDGTFAAGEWTSQRCLPEPYHQIWTFRFSISRRSESVVIT